MNSFTPQEVAINMFHAGEIPLLCEANEKKPKLTGWKETKYNSEAEVSNVFNLPDCNIGWLIQDDQYVIDIDDKAIANNYAERILKMCGINCEDAVGRASKPFGKVFVKSQAGIKPIRAMHPSNGKVIVETLTKGKNAIIPPSKFNGEVFKAYNPRSFDGEFQFVTPDELKNAVRMLELYSLLNEFYPTADRDNAMLSLVRMFAVKNETFPEFVSEFIQTLAMQNGDDERMRKTLYKQYEQCVDKTTDVRKELTKYWHIKDEAVKDRIDEILGNETQRSLKNWKPLVYETQLDIMNKKFDAPKFLISGILPIGLTCLAGRPKRGKTRFIDWVSQCIADGKPVWDRDTVKGDVFQLLLEDTQEDVNIRGVEMNITDGNPHKVPITMEKWDGSTLGKGVEEHIEDWIRRVDNPQLVVIDTYVKVSSYKKGKDIYREQSVELGRLQQIAKMNQIAIVLIHHTTKATYEDIFDEISGSTALQGICDTLMVMGGQRGKSEKAVPLYIIGRRIEDTSFVITPDLNNNWENLGEGADKLDPSKRPQEKWITKIFEAIDAIIKEQEPRIGATTKQITDYLKLTNPNLSVSECKEFPQMKKNYENYYKKLKRMQSNGELSVGKNDFHFLPSIF